MCLGKIFLVSWCKICKTREIGYKIKASKINREKQNIVREKKRNFTKCNNSIGTKILRRFSSCKVRIPIVEKRRNEKWNSRKSRIYQKKNKRIIPRNVIILCISDYIHHGYYDKKLFGVSLV